MAVCESWQGKTLTLTLILTPTLTLTPALTLNVSCLWSNSAVIHTRSGTATSRWMEAA